MHKVAFELLQARDSGPAPLVQDTCGIGEDLAFVLEDLASFVLKLELPDPRVLVPDRLDELGVELNALPQVELVGRLLDVCEDLGGFDVVRRPIGVRCPGECVDVGRNIACRSQV